MIITTFFVSVLLKMQQISVAIKSLWRENVKWNKCINFSRSQWAIVFAEVVLPPWLPIFVYILHYTQRKIALCRPVIESIHNVTTFLLLCETECLACGMPNAVYVERLFILSAVSVSSLDLFIYIYFFFFFIHFRNYLIEILLFWFSFHFATLLTATAMATVYVCRASVCVCMWINWFLLAQFL